MKKVKIDKKRHILKSITWRILATLFTFLYKKVKDGNIKNFTGIDDPYEIPKNPYIIINTKDSPKDSVSYLFERIYSIDGF